MVIYDFAAQNFFFGQDKQDKLPRNLGSLSCKPYLSCLKIHISICRNRIITLSLSKCIIVCIQTLFIPHHNLGKTAKTRSIISSVISKCVTKRTVCGPKVTAKIPCFSNFLIKSLAVIPATVSKITIFD